MSNTFGVVAVVAEEVRDPQRNARRATVLSLVAARTFALLVALLLTSARAWLIGIVVLVGGALAYAARGRVLRR